MAASEIRIRLGGDDVLVLEKSPVFLREVGQHPGGDHPGEEEPGGDHPGEDEPGGDHPGASEPGGNAKTNQTSLRSAQPSVEVNHDEQGAFLTLAG